MQIRLRVPTLWLAMSLSVALIGCSSSKEVSLAPGTAQRQSSPVGASNADPPIVTSELEGGVVAGGPIGGEATVPLPPLVSSELEGGAVPAQPPPPTPETIPEVTSTVVGTANAGSNGGIGEGSTDSFSEMVRNEDGTCSGWDGRGLAAKWTVGMVSGAAFQILDRETKEVIGTGNLDTSVHFDADDSDREQWTCQFPFSAEVQGNPEEFYIKVADLDPWLVRRDSAQRDRFITSVSTEASITYFDECVNPSGAPISEWSAVGSYWSDGLRTICSNGLVVVKLERPCRQSQEGSDHVVKVASAQDPTLILEDSSGLLVDVATLAPGTEVIVSIATGRTCS